MTLRDTLYDPGRMPIIGGRLCLDLANTANKSPSGIENCRLSDFGALTAWAEHVGVIDARARSNLLEAAAAHPVAAAEAMLEVLRLREAIWEVFPIRGKGFKLPDAIRQAQLVTPDYTPRAVKNRLVFDPGKSLSAWICQPAAFSALELLSAGPTERVKECGGKTCGWLFVDDSPTGRRRWCSMALCGNRAKARRFVKSKVRSTKE